MKKYVDKRAGRQNETRDAVLWEILELERKARVKIANSDKLITVHYPRNWSALPQWARVGNAVRIIHRGGLRGRLEVVGHGRSLPSGTAGGVIVPPVIPGVDALISGLFIKPTSPASNCVEVTEGYVRINGEVYHITSAGATPMGGAAPPTMGQGQLLGVAATVCLDPAPTEFYFRYDMLQVGEDGVIDYLPGVEVFEGPPQKPTALPDHVVVGYILRYFDDGVIIENEWIDTDWTTPRPTTLAVSDYDKNIGLQQLIGAAPHARTIIISVLDQYGRGLRANHFGRTYNYGSYTFDITGLLRPKTGGPHGNSYIMHEHTMDGHGACETYQRTTAGYEITLQYQRYWQAYQVYIDEYSYEWYAYGGDYSDAWRVDLQNWGLTAVLSFTMCGFDTYMTGGHAAMWDCNDDGSDGDIMPPGAPC